MRSSLHPYAGGTELRYELDWTGGRRYVGGKALAPCGCVHTLSRIGRPDTFFSLPASIRTTHGTTRGTVTEINGTLVFSPDTNANAKQSTR